MAAAIPSALKAADIARFAQRAGQVEKAKPVVAYWCNYWIIEQILAKGLHQADDECKSYTMNLMDKLEQAKSDFKDNDAIADELAGQAYIEQFALETFQRADNAMKANRASRQTADTFQAAATFLELCQIWGPLDPEIASKIKFAKFHSLRILKAMKAGEDPNLSNPVPEPVEEQPLDPNDPEVQMLNGSGGPQHRDNSRQPSVIEVPDEHDDLQGALAQRSTQNESLHPSRAPSVPTQPTQDYQPAPQGPGEDYYHNAVPSGVSPLAPASTDRTVSEGGGYFPTVPGAMSRASGHTLPDAPPTGPGSPPAAILPDPSALPPPGASGFHTSRPPPIDSLHSFPPPNVDDSNSAPCPSAPVPTYPNAPPPASTPPIHSQPSATLSQVSQTPVQPSLPTPGAPVRHAAPPRAMAPPPAPSQAVYSTDEEAISKAQKHARWAISALNFEDVNTAVKELRGALESLGPTFSILSFIVYFLGENTIDCVIAKVSLDFPFKKCVDRPPVKAIFKYEQNECPGQCSSHKIEKHCAVKDEFLQDPDVKWNFLDVVPMEDFLRPINRTRSQPQLNPRNWTRRVIDDGTPEEIEGKKAASKARSRKPPSGSSHTAEQGDRAKHVQNSKSREQRPADEHNDSKASCESDPPVQRPRARKRKVGSTQDDNQEHKSEAPMEKLKSSKQRIAITRLDSQEEDKGRTPVQVLKAGKQQPDSDSQGPNNNVPSARDLKARRQQPPNTPNDGVVGCESKPPMDTPIPRRANDATAFEITQKILAASETHVNSGQPIKKKQQVRQIVQSFNMPNPNPAPVPDPSTNMGYAIKRKLQADGAGQSFDVPKPNSVIVPESSINTSHLTKRQLQSHTPVQTFKAPNQNMPLDSNTSSDSELPLATKLRGMIPLTPSMSSMQTPATAIDQKVIILDDDSGSDQPKESTAAKAKQEPLIKTSASSTDLKAEPLSQEMISRTFLRVSADHMPYKGPVRVPLSMCSTSESLFPVLMAERKISYNIRARVSDITAKLDWNKQSIGLRKDRADDWSYFCESIQKAWQKEGHRFEEGCYIDMMIHIDDAEGH